MNIEQSHLRIAVIRKANNDSKKSKPTALRTAKQPKLEHAQLDRKTTIEQQTTTLFTRKHNDKIKQS
jgi:hypothetical protein